MAETYKVLGQASPSATTLVDLYTVPVGASTIGSSVIICNRSSTDTTFRLSVAVAGAADANKQYLYYDHDARGNETFIATIGVTLAATDVVRVYATSATLSFSMFGTEVT